MSREQNIAALPRLHEVIGDVTLDSASLHGQNLRTARVLHDLLDYYEAPATADHTIVFALAQTKDVVRFYGASESGSAKHARLTTIMPAGREVTWRSDSLVETLHISIDDAILRRHINDTLDIDPASVDVLDTMGNVDDQIAKLAPMILRQIHDPTPATKLMLDGFEQVVAAHLITHYSSSSRTIPSARTLDDASLDRVMDYMRGHLEEDISLEDLASHTTLSLFSFARAFKAATGTSPHQMLLAERIARTAELLRNTETPLAEIAYAVGFSSQSHMTTTFARHMGVTPGRYRKDLRS